MKRGEVRRYTFRLPDKRRPVLILSLDAVVDVLNELIAVPADSAYPSELACKR